MKDEWTPSLRLELASDGREFGQDGLERYPVVPIDFTDRVGGLGQWRNRANPTLKAATRATALIAFGLGLTNDARFTRTAHPGVTRFRTAAFRVRKIDGCITRQW